MQIGARRRAQQKSGRWRAAQNMPHGRAAPQPGGQRVGAPQLKAAPRLNSARPIRKTTATVTADTQAESNRTAASESPHSRIHRPKTR